MTESSGKHSDRPEKDVTSTQAETSAGVEHVLRTGFVCNERCLFCFVDLGARRVSLDDIAANLDAVGSKSPGRNRLSLSGGEPSGDPRIRDIVKMAREKGFQDIELQTNAAPLRSKKLVDDLVTLGVKYFFISFHSFRPEIYDAVTGSRGQYPLAVKGIGNVLANPQAAVAFNIVINRLNLPGLPEQMDFFHGLGRKYKRPIRVFFSLMNGAGHRKAPSIAVDMREISGPFNEALKRCKKLGITVERFIGPSAPPACLAEDPGPYAGDHPVSQEDVGEYPDESDGITPPARAKRRDCRHCRYDRRCGGVSLEYARLFGVDALRP